jgi:methyl-accepting chemotaxis protein
MNDTNEEASLTLDKKTVDVLVAHIIPTSKYFEARFDHMQGQIDHLSENIRDFRSDVDRRFEGVNQRFEQVDKRFEEVDRRFEQVDKRFEQVIASIDRLADKLDYRDEKQRGFTLRMFTIAIGISILGALGTFLKSMGIL